MCKPNTAALGSLLIAVALVASVATPSNAAPARSERAASRVFVAGKQIVIGPRPSYRRPATVPGASDVQLFPYTNPPGTIYQIAAFAFDPTGSFWFVDGENDVVRYTASGTPTQLNISRAWPIGAPPIVSAGIAYANNRIWFNAVGGFERIDLSGSGRRFFQTSGGESEVVGAGPNGSVWLVEPETSGYAIARVDSNLNVTRYPIATPEVPYYQEVGPDGLVYFNYLYTSSSGQSLSSVIRMNADGSETRYDGATLYNGAFSNGGLYYTLGGLGFQQLVLAFLSLATGTTTYTPIDGFTDGDIYNLIAAPDGTLWFAGLVGPASGPTNTELFSYDPAKNQISGPYEPSILNLVGSPIALGPDGNMYFPALLHDKEYIARYDRSSSTSRRAAARR